MYIQDIIYHLNLLLVSVKKKEIRENITENLEEFSTHRP
jgi:hypothetical protein